jgi:hypothetical protein
MKNKIIKSAVLFIITAIALLPTGLNAQDQGLGDMIFTVGTVTHTDSPAQDWAWIQLMATSESLLKNRAMDIYLKPGDATSTNLFTLKGRTTQVTDVRTIAALLTRGAMLGENLSNLEVAVNSLYAEATPIETLSLAEKISALIAGSQDDAELYKNLVFMGRAHPAISMVIGQGFACPIFSSGFSTIEIRAHSDNEIIGSITLQAGAPDILPAPGPITRILEQTPKGNLNIRLRWDVPDNLKKVSLLQFGYNLYRMTESFAIANGYDTNAPSRIAITNLVATDTNVVKVNKMPILVDTSSDSNSWFIVDDNNQYSGGAPFIDGNKYYYFVSALDLLGRDGELSQGYMTFPCDRMAPIVPHGIQARTVSDYVSGVETQWVEISWMHETNDNDTARYYIYRYNGLANMQSNAIYAVSNRISGAIVPAANDTRMYYEDRTLSSNDWGISYTYTVRAEDNASCGNNLSGNSAPVFGTMRKWQGPIITNIATVYIQSESLTCQYIGSDKLSSLGSSFNVELSCSRPTPDSEIKWAEFSYYSGTYQGAGTESNATFLGRYYFRPYSTNLHEPFMVDVDTEEFATFFCRVGSISGKTSNYAVGLTRINDYNLIFAGNQELVITAVDSTNHLHHWGYPVKNPQIYIPPTANAETYRLYHRIDGGKRTLVWQGEMSLLWGALAEDYTGGAVNGSKICYYYQLFDKHGNVSPMKFICCFEAEPRADLPTPILATIDSTGTATNNPGLELNWFCAPPGIEYFEIAVALDEGDLPATFTTENYPLYGTTNNMEVVVNGVTNSLSLGFYRTSRVGTSFGTAGSPQFIADSNIELDREYTILVRAIGSVGTEGPWSNAETFQWKSVPTAGNPVPWPARGLPIVQNETFNTNLAPEYLSLDSKEGIFGYTRIGIRIGELPNGRVTYANKDYIRLDGLYNPMTFLYTNSIVTNQTVMPCVLYRYQLANDLYPTVSGDTVQVSPMMEKIAYGNTIEDSRIYDPFIAIARDLDSSDNWGMYLLDTQPVARGAKYQYLILRFDENTKEMDRIIPAGTITIP